MKLKFDSNLEYQLEAIQAVLDLFEGLPPKQSGFEISVTAHRGQVEGFNELGVGNRLMLHHDQLLKNLHAVRSATSFPNPVHSSKKAIRTDSPTSLWKWKRAPARLTSTYAPFSN